MDLGESSGFCHRLLFKLQRIQDLGESSEFLISWFLSSTNIKKALRVTQQNNEPGQDQLDQEQGK
jgi:hypothetical protein